MATMWQKTPTKCGKYSP